MPGDINAYALGLELQLQTDKASASLQKFKEQLIGIEKAVTIAPNVIPTKEIRQATEATRAYGDETEFANKVITQMYRGFLDYQKMVDDANEGSGLLTKSVDRQTKQFIKARSEIERSVKVLRDLDLEKTFGPKKAKFIQAAISRFEGLGGAVQDLTANATKQNEVLNSALGIFDSAGESGAIFKQILKDIALGAGAAAVAFELARHSLSGLIQMQDAYVTITMRAIGTTDELIATTNDLSMALGATTEEGVATLQALAAAGFRANESISQMAKTNFMFSQATGVGTKQTAAFQRAVFTTSRDAALTTIAVSEMAAAIRHSGMSADEAAGLMGNLTKAMRPLRFLYGETQALAASKAIAQFTAVVRRAGGDADVAAQELTALAQSPEQMITSFAMVGANLKKLDFAEYLEKATQKVAQLGQGAQSMGKALTSEAIVKAMHVSATMADNYAQVWKAADGNVKKFKELMATQTSGADVQEDFNQTLQTFTKSIKQAVQPLLALGTIVLDTIVPALQFVLKPLTAVASYVSAFAAGLSRIPVVGSLVKAAIGTMMILPIINLTSKFLGFGKVFGSVTDLITKSKPVYDSFSLILQRQANKSNLLSQQTLGLIKNNLFGVSVSQQSTKAIIQEGKAIGAAVVRLRELNGLKVKAITATRGLASITKVAKDSYSQFALASENAGGGLMGMGSGVMSVVGSLAKAHPAIAAVAAALAAAFIVVPQLVEWFDKGGAAVKILTGALLVLMAPLTYTYVSLKALWAVVEGVWDAVSDLAEEAFKPLSDAFKQLFGDAKGNVSVMKIFENVLHKITLGVKAAIKMFEPLMWVVKKVSSLFASMIDIVKGVWDAVKDNAAVKFIIKAIQTIDDFLKKFEKTDKAVNQASKDNRTFEEKMWGVKPDKLTKAQKSVTNYGQALKEVAKPEVSKAIDQAYEKVESVAEPVIKQTTKVASRDDSAKILATGLGKLSMPLLQLLAALGKDKQLEVLEAINKTLGDTLPKIAEGQQGSLGPTAANNWIS